MCETKSSSWWDKFLDFMESSAGFFNCCAAIGGPIALGVAYCKIVKRNTAAQLQVIQAQDASWLMRQEYLRQQSNAYGKKQ